MRHFYILIGLLIASAVFGQDRVDDNKVVQTFRHTRVINMHSVETLPAHKLDFRVVHRFGDLAGESGGWTTFYGLESASDIAIGLEYGLSDRTMVGITRTKGSGPLKQNLNGLFKYKIMEQRENSSATFSMAAVGLASYSTMQKSSLEGQITSFDKSSHRLTYHLGLQIARKFSDRFSLQLGGSWTARNVVEIGDKNDIAALNAGMRIQATKSMGIIFDAVLPMLSDERDTGVDYTIPLAVGFEFDTGGGHVFQVNLTNSRGISETDFIPYTSSSWGEGEFRLGFTISRLFSL